MAGSTTSSAPSAVYNSPSGTHTFTIPPQRSHTSETTTKTQAQTAHLSALRASTKQLQSDINTFLTTKMEEDKTAASAANSNDKKSSKSRDEEEEENYGEETVEDD